MQHCNNLNIKTILRDLLTIRGVWTVLGMNSKRNVTVNYHVNNGGVGPGLAIWTVWASLLWTDLVVRALSNIF